MDDEVTAVQALKALAHPVRLGMLRKLAAAGEICACDFTDDFGISQPTVSAHLRTLREAGLVTTRRDGTTICYSVVPEALTELGGHLVGLGRAAVRPVASLTDRIRLLLTASPNTANRPTRTTAPAARRSQPGLRTVGWSGNATA